MCTVTYLPLADGCIITSNRDEALSRAPAEPPTLHDHNGTTLLFPKDPRGQGSWIASSNMASVCLFNGAFEAHVPSPPYKHSRGLIPLEVLTHPSLDAFVASYDLSGIEPFSIVVYHPGELKELKWDGSTAHVFAHDVDQPHIWASATLYSKDVREQRQHDFQSWLSQRPSFTQEEAMHFHTQPSTDRENGLLIARASGLQTVSVTSMKHVHGCPTHMRYRDLISEREVNSSPMA